MGVGNVTLMTRVTGFEELQSEMFDRDPRSSFVTELAWPTWGVPLLLTCLSAFAWAIRLDLGSPLVSPGGDPVVWVFPSPAYEGGEPPTRGGALFLVPDHAVVVGHT